MSNLKKELHSYAKNGWHVHPLRDLEKLPRLGGWQEKSTASISKIKRWLNMYPTANYGIVTGSRSDIWVLDIDRKNGKDGLFELKNAYPVFDLATLNTPIVETPSGGYHVYFKYPASGAVSNSTNVLPGVDVRGNGGFVVAPPSVLEVMGNYVKYKWIHGSYLNIDEEGECNLVGADVFTVTDAPDYLIDLVTKKTQTTSGVSSKSSPNGISRQSGATLNTDGVSKGARDDYIFKLIWSLKGKGLDKQEALLQALTAAANCTPAFDENSVFEKVDRIYDNGSCSTFGASNAYSSDANDDEEEIISKFNERYAVVIAGNKTVVLDEKRNLSSDSINECLLTFDDFKKFYSNKRTDVSDGSGKTKSLPTSVFWLNHERRRQYENIVFDPSNNHTNEEYNFWKGFPVEGIQGDSSMFWDFLKGVICSGDEESYVYLRKWIAHIFQKPEELPRTAIAIMGKQGTGKSTLTKMLSKLLYKQNYLEVSSVNRLLGQFNGNLANRVLVNANEATWGGDKSHGGELKAMISEPTMTIEMKGRDSFQYGNYARFVFTSNSSYPVNAESDDRRFVFLECSNSRKNDVEYWNELNSWMCLDSSMEALMYDLQNEDIAEWNANNRPSNNVVKQLEVKYQSMSTIDKFVYQWVYERTVEKYDSSSTYPSGYVINFKDFYDEYKHWVEKSGIHDRYTTVITLSTAVKNKLIQVESKRSNGKTMWHLDSWDSIYGYYCKNVIYCDPKWNGEYESPKNASKASEQLKLVMGKRKGSGG